MGEEEEDKELRGGNADEGWRVPRTESVYRDWRSPGSCSCTVVV
jgi:hypothetical protein